MTTAATPPTPSVIRTVLSDPKRVGLTNADEARALHTILSYFYGPSSDIYRRGHQAALRVMLAAATLDEGVCLAWLGDAPEEGAPLEGPIVAAPAVRVPQGTTTMTHLGLDGHELRGRYNRDQARRRRGWAYALVGADDMLRIVPPEAWPVLAEIVRRGPHALQQRLTAWLAWIAIGRPDPEAVTLTSGGQGDLRPLSVASATGQLAMVGTFVAALCRSAEAGVPAGIFGELAAWEAFRPPKPSSYLDRRTRVSRSPSTPTLRRGLRALLTAVDLDGRDPRPQDDIHRTMQRLVFSALTVSTMLRIEAIRLLNVGDVLASYRYSDGAVAPAILARRVKSRQLESAERQAQPIPDGVHGIITAYMRLKGMIDASGSLVCPPEWPLMVNGRRWDTPKRRRTGVELPARELSRMSGGGLSALTPTRAQGRRRGFNGDGSGFSANELRSGAAQAMVEALSDLQRDDPDRYRALFRGHRPSVIAEACNNHSVSFDDPLGYLGASKEKDVEVLKLRARTILWDYLTGDLGARKGPDIEAIRRVSRELDDLRLQRDEIQKARKAHRRRLRGIDTRLGQAGLSPREAGDLEDEKARRWDEDDDLEDLLASLTAEDGPIASRVKLVDRLENDRAAWIVLPDFTREEEELLESGLLPTSEGVRPDQEDALPNDEDVAILADLIPRADLAKIIGRSRQQTNRLLRADYLRAARNADRIPWTADDPPLTPDGRWIVVEKLILGRMTSEERRLLRESQAACGLSSGGLSDRHRQTSSGPVRL